MTTFCYKCYGTGTMRKRDIIGTVRFVGCAHCKNTGRVWVKDGSGAHKIGRQIVPGLGPGIRKGHSKYDAADGKRRLDAR